MKKILILGSTGMMGSMLSSLLRNDQRFNILCTYRNTNKVKFLDLKKKQKTKIEIFNKHELNKLIHKFNPDYLINCIGLIKQLCRKENLQFIKYLNTDLPKIIALSAKKNKFNVIHLSTDCVFYGNKGNGQCKGIFLE